MGSSWRQGTLSSVDVFPLDCFTSPPTVYHARRSTGRLPSSDVTLTSRTSPGIPASRRRRRPQSVMDDVSGGECNGRLETRGNEKFIDGATRCNDDDDDNNNNNQANNDDVVRSTTKNALNMTSPEAELRICRAVSAELTAKVGSRLHTSVYLFTVSN